MKKAYYFSHDNNARNDEKILCLKSDHGLLGYGVYWVLIEMMHESDETALRHDRIKGISYQNNIDITLLLQIISDAITYKLFESDGELFWSNSLRKRKSEMTEKMKKLSFAGKAGMAKRWGLDNNVITPDNKVITIKGNKRKEKEKKLNKIKTKEEDISLFVSQLKENPAFEGINIEKELYKMDAWFLLPQGKGRKKTKKFILNWLNKAERDYGGNNVTGSDTGQRPDRFTGLNEKNYREGLEDF